MLRVSEVKITKIRNYLFFWVALQRRSVGTLCRAYVFQGVVINDSNAN